MGDVEELFDCFDDEDEEKPQTVPIVMEPEDNSE